MSRWGLLGRLLIGVCAININSSAHAQVAPHAEAGSHAVASSKAWPVKKDFGLLLISIFIYSSSHCYFQNSARNNWTLLGNERGNKKADVKLDPSAVFLLVMARHLNHLHFLFRFI